MSDTESGSDLDALFALARQNRPDTTRTQYGFETRLMARLRARRQPDTSSLWATVTWRMIPFFATVVVALALWNSAAVMETNDAAGLSLLQNPDAANALSGLN